MKPSAVKSILNILLTLQAQSEWQVRHGGLLGIKYLLAVRKDMTDVLLPMVLSPLIGGLEDSDDDVRAVSATAMLPVVDQMLSMSDQVKVCLMVRSGLRCTVDVDWVLVRETVQFVSQNVRPHFGVILFDCILVKPV